MRIHVTFIDRVGITQEVLALLGGRNLNLDAVEMVPPNVYIDAPTLSPEVLDELREALFKVRGVQAVTIVDILPGQRRHLQLDALLAAMTDPVLAVDSQGRVLLANPALIALYGREPAGESITELFNDPAAVGDFLRLQLGDRAHEVFAVLLLPYLGMSLLVLMSRALDSRGLARTVGVISAVFTLGLLGSLALLALVMGAEGPGLRDRTRETCDMIARIPFAGGFGSLNVSNAAAVSLYAASQRLHHDPAT